MLDSDEFLSEYGIRSLSKYHLNNPYTMKISGLLDQTVKNWRYMTESGLRKIQVKLFIDMNQLADIVLVERFRDDMEDYLGRVDHLQHGATSKVRILEPTSQGLPVQVFCHTSLTEWKDYEPFLSKVYLRFLEKARTHGLVLYQEPTSKLHVRS